MSVRRLASNDTQPKSFAFTADNLDWVKGQITKYPEGRQASAVIPILWRAQEQSGGWLPKKAIEYVADMLGMAHIRVLEVATFYTMFQLEPVGRKAHVQLCGTTPCMLRGAEDLETPTGGFESSNLISEIAAGRYDWELHPVDYQRYDAASTALRMSLRLPSPASPRASPSALRKV